MDFHGADALLRAVESDSLSPSDADSLLRVHGVRRMVDNVSRFFPNTGGAPAFARDVQAFARTKKGGEDDGYFQLSEVFGEREHIRALMSSIRANQANIAGDALSRLAPYLPETGPLTFRLYFTAGGVSDGFAFEHEPGAFYVNLVRAAGNCEEMQLNLMHEGYHAMQIAAQRRAGTFRPWLEGDTIPMMDRLLGSVLMEGTANFVADPGRMPVSDSGPSSSRARFDRATAPAELARSFAVFDTVVAQVRLGTTTWEKLYTRGFRRSEADDDRFYFVGYAMARALARECGAACIGALFREPPVVFFQRYVDLSRRTGARLPRFASETEAFLLQYRH